MLFGELRDAVAVVKRVVGAVDPSRLKSADALALLEVFSEGEKLCSTGKTLVAVRAADTNEWARKGHRTPAAWLAGATGVTQGEARNVLESSERLDDLPATAAAARQGALSQDVLNEIASAGSAANEGRLLDAARRGLRDLQETARKIKAAQPGADDRYAAIRASRRFRTWTGNDGAFCFDGRLTPDAGALLKAAVDAEADKIFREARANGVREPFDAYAADALVRVATRARGEGEPAAPRVMAHLTVPIALLRGDGRGDDGVSEMAEIAGVGPVPVSVARDLLGDCFFKILVTDGVDVAAITSRKRSIREPIRWSLYERSGKACEIEGCHLRSGLQIHHWRVDFAKDGPTELANLMLICSHHHDRITNDGFDVAQQPDGAFRLVPP